jgi:L-aminopeptidase/D-esterase-like protein
MIVKHRCPYCGREHTDLTGVARKGTPARRPGPGDLTICIRCGEWSVFARNGRTRKPTAAEAREIATSRLCRHARQAWEQMIAAVRTAGHA